MLILLHPTSSLICLQVDTCACITGHPDMCVWRIRYMPAELLLEGKMTKAADVYGFSMLAWELFTGEQLFQGLRQSQVLATAASQ